MILPSIHKEIQPQHDAMQLDPRHDMRYGCEDADAHAVQCSEELITRNRMWAVSLPGRADLV